MDMMTGAEADRKLSVMQVFASPGWGGGEKYAFDLSVALARDGHMVTVVSRRSDIIRNISYAASAPRSSPGKPMRFSGKRKTNARTNRNILHEFRVKIAISSGPTSPTTIASMGKSGRRNFLNLRKNSLNTAG